MRELLSGADLVNLLVMMRTADGRTWVVLEQPEDCQLLDSFIASESAATYPAHSRAAAEEAAGLIAEVGLSRVLAILGTGVGEVEGEVIHTDDRDLTATAILSGDVLERLLGEGGEERRRHKHLGAIGTGVRELIMRVASAAELLRSISERGDHGLDCAPAPGPRALNSARDDVDCKGLVAEVLERSPVAELDAQLLASELASEVERVDERRFSSGRDLIAVLAHLLEHWGEALTPAALKTRLRNAFRCEDLKKTSLYDGVEEWAKRNRTTVWNCA